MLCRVRRRIGNASIHCVRGVAMLHALLEVEGKKKKGYALR